MVMRHQRGERFAEPWRFKNQKDVSVGDRFFALRQGKAGPAIFGYGSSTQSSALSLSTHGDPQ